MLIAATPRTTPDEWGATNRTYKPSAGVPGPRDPWLTPYMVPFGRAVAEGTHRRVVMAMFAQGGKSETLLDIIGQRLDHAPGPILYVGPNKQFLTEQWEPRVMDLLDQAPTLAAKVARGKRMTKTRKIISGVPLRLAHGGSSTALKSDPAALALTDEADELESNVRGQGDPVGLIDARGDTYADFVHAIVSTPSKGPKDTMRDETSGLDFWAEQDPADIDSKVWRLWQEGTRYHWTWRCPHCGLRFIPRFECLEIPDIKRTSVARAKDEAHIVCPRSGCVIGDEYREAMNKTGCYAAPGQWFDEQDQLCGSPPDSDTISFWVSGLCSPFKSFGERAAAYVAALRTGDGESIKTVVNAGFGELWAPVGGDVPEWEEVRNRALPYKAGDVPEGVMVLVCGVDVQKNRLVFVIRGFGTRQESWLIQAGEIWGDTAQDDVWTDLSELLTSRFGGLHITRTFIDAGFRPGKKDLVPEHKVYEFVRRHSRIAYATKGYDTRPTPLTVNRIDVNPKGAKAKYGIDLVRLSSDFFKSWVHERIRWPLDQPGGWHLFEDVTEDYCRQIVSEARMRKPGGGHQWVQTSRDNHFLDCESLAFAAAYMLGIQRLRDDARPVPRPEEPPPSATPPPAAAQPKPKRVRDSAWLGNSRGFL